MKKIIFIMLPVILLCVSCRDGRFGDQMKDVFNECKGERTMTISAGNWGDIVEVSCTDRADK